MKLGNSTMLKFSSSRGGGWIKIKAPKKE